MMRRYCRIINLLFKPLQSPETRRLTAWMMIGWGILYQFVDIMGAPKLFMVPPEDVANVLGAALVGCGAWLLGTIHSKRYTWQGRIAALAGIAVLVTLASLGHFMDFRRATVIFNSLLLSYGLLGEAIVPEE